MERQSGKMEYVYTSESLKMLESEEGQLNAVFACFGSAVQHAQLFEQGLARFLTTYNKISSDPISVEEIVHKKTMGQLIRRFGKHITVSDESITEGFSIALKERNYLVHHFFLERDSELRSNAGRMQLLVELVSIEKNFDRCRVAINAMRIAMCRTLDIDDEWSQDYSDQ